MADPWTSHASVSLGGPDDRVTLVEGSAFMICAPDGDVSPDIGRGVLLPGHQIPLAAGPFASTDRPPKPWPAPWPTPTRPPLWPGPGPTRAGPTRTSWSSGAATWAGACARTWSIRNFGEEPAYCAVEVVYGADFADLFAVKEDRVDRQPANGT